MSARVYSGVIGKSKEVSELVSKEEKKGNMRAIARPKHLLTVLLDSRVTAPRKAWFSLSASARSRYLPTNLLTSVAFTMAEILLSLTIIGVVAAITLPSLTGNINERTWNTQRKALYARMSQAISLMPALNGYGKLTEDASGSIVEDTAAETFVTSGLSKVLKINNICDDTHLTDCGIPTFYIDMLGSKKPIPTTLYSLNAGFSSPLSIVSGYSYSTMNTRAAAFETQNGESIVTYYNQSCRTEYLSYEQPMFSGENFGFPQSTMCVNFIYDLNGNKGPNTVGKDIGVITVLNSVDSIVVAPMPSSARLAGGSEAKYTWSDAIKICTKENSESRLPNIEELSAMLINKALFNITNGGIWSSSPYSGNIYRAWRIIPEYNARYTCGKSTPNGVRCVRR